MSKTKNSRYKINKALAENYGDVPFWETNISNDFSRHPRRKRPRHTLVKEWRIARTHYTRWCTNFYLSDGRIGDCYDRSDRQGGSKRCVHGLRRAYEKRLVQKELENI